MILYRFIATMLAITLVVTTFAQKEEKQPPPATRGVSPVNKALPPAKDGRYYIFTIGIDHYENWLDLHNAVSDARGIGALLTQHFGFENILPPLYNAEANHDRILRSFDMLRSLLKPEDNLLIFFAGHGHTRVDTIGGQIIESGYLIPSDGDALDTKAWYSYLNINHFLDRASLLPARHVTVIFDACHSGFALGSAASGTRGVESYSVEVSNSISRRVITSARRSQLALDSGPVAGHSLFTGSMIQGLTEAKADLDNDGLVTTSELGLYLQQSVNHASDGTQTPDFGTFQLDQRGEMILELGSDAPAILLNNALAQLRSGELATFRKTFRHLQKLNLPLSQTFYLQYRYAMMENNIDLALQTLQSIVELKEGEIEKSNLHAAYKTSVILEYWSDLLKITTPLDPALELDLMEVEDASKSLISADSIRATYRFPINSSFQIKMTNHSEQPMYIYCLLMDEDGMIEVLQIWEDPELRYGHGLLPGTSALTYKFEHPNLRGIEYFRLFVSPEPIDAFVSPPSYIRMENNRRPKIPPGIRTQIFELAFGDFSQ